MTCDKVRMNIVVCDVWEQNHWKEGNKMKPSFSNLEVLKFAIGMEDSGIDFYESYAKKATGEIETLFLKLADDERRHSAIFNELLEENMTDGSNFDYMFDESVTSYFESYAKSEGFSREPGVINTLVEAITEGIATEAITIAYYEDLLKYSKGKTTEMLEVLIAEETTHLEKLKALL